MVAFSKMVDRFPSFGNSFARICATFSPRFSPRFSLPCSYLKEEKYAVLGENFSAPKYVKLIQKQAIARGQPSKENAKINFWTRLLLKQRSKDF